MEKALKRRDKARAKSLRAELALPPFPAEGGYLWSYYSRIRRRIAPGLSGHAPVSWQDIDAFVRRAGVRLAPWEVEIIEAIDDEFLRPLLNRTELANDEGAKELASARDGAGVKAIIGAVGGRRRVVRRKR